MFVPIPVLIVLGLVILGLAALLLSRRRDGGRDLMRPPASISGAPVIPAPPMVPPMAPDDGAMPAAAPAGEAADALLLEVRMLLMQGRKIEAIKQVRDCHPSMGLKEAKDWVERLETGQG